MSISQAWFQIDGFTDRRRGIPPLDVLYGPDRVAELGHYLSQRGMRRVLLVAGAQVSANERVMQPIRESLGRLVVGEFFEATPSKRIESVYAGIDRMQQVGADVLVGIGSGSSLVTARQISAFAADGRPLAYFQEAARTGDQPRFARTQDHTPVTLIPTTLAGADLSTGGTLEVLAAHESDDGHPRRVNPLTVGPMAILYDPRLFESTPRQLLAGSAMNGLNKGIETIYSPNATLYSDALATRGVTLMSHGLLELPTDERAGLERAVAGVILVQLQRNISVLHAFGQAITRHSSLQLGVAHAVLTPDVLRLLLSLVPLRRDVLAAALRAAGVSSDGDDANAVVEGVVAVRDALDLPSRLGGVPGADGLDLMRCAEHVCADKLLADAPLERPLTVAEALSVFEAAR